jgi:hypothetical protein
LLSEVTSYYGKGMELSKLKKKYGADQVGNWVHQLYQEILSKRVERISFKSEVPVLALDESGAVVSGVIDLLVETEDMHLLYKFSNYQNSFKHNKLVINILINLCFIGQIMLK